MSQLAGARLVGVIGGKLLLFGGIMVGGVLTLLIPLLATLGPYWVFTMRLFIGISQVGCVAADITYCRVRKSPNDSQSLLNSQNKILVGE